LIGSAVEHWPLAVGRLSDPDCSRLLCRAVSDVGCSFALSGGVEEVAAERAHSGPAWRAYRFTFAWLHAERGELDQAREDFETALADGFASLPRDVNGLDAAAPSGCAAGGTRSRWRPSTM
jgi:hypothetical protein